MKIVNLELYARALRARGIEVDIVEMEIKGIPRTLEAHGITAEELGVEGMHPLLPPPQRRHAARERRQSDARATG